MVGLSFGSDAALSVLDPSQCSWKPVEIDGQQFESLDELNAEAKQQGADPEQWDVAFRERDGQLEYRGTDCGTREVTEQ